MRFHHDRRGQSVVIGVVILFGFLIVALSLYQVQIVPQQNGQLEFEHYESVQDDLIELRAGIITAGQADTPQFKTIQLGTSYPVRVFTLNPPDPVGAIETRGPYNITITNGTTTRSIPTRFIRYEPGYNEIRQTPIWYDTTALYVDARASRSGFAVLEDQNLVTDSGTIRLTAIQNTFTESGTGRVTLELYPTETSTESLPTGNLTVSVPTRLTGEEYWDTATIPAANYEGVSEDEYATGIHELNLTASAESVKVNTVGIQSEPAEGAVKENVGVGTGNGDSGSGSSELSGTLTAEVTQEGASPSGGNQDWIVTISYDGSEAVEVTASPSTPGSGNSDPQPDTATISQSANSVTLNLGRGNSNDIYPITITGQNNAGESCSATLNQGDSQINVCA